MQFFSRCCPPPFSTNYGDVVFLSLLSLSLFHKLRGCSFSVIVVPLPTPLSLFNLVLFFFAPPTNYGDAVFLSLLSFSFFHKLRGCSFSVVVVTFHSPFFLLNFVFFRPATNYGDTVFRGGRSADAVKRPLFFIEFSIVFFLPPTKYWGAVFSGGGGARLLSNDFF